MCSGPALLYLGLVVLLPLQLPIPRCHLPLQLIGLVSRHRQPPLQLPHFVLQGSACSTAGSAFNQDAAG